MSDSVPIERSSEKELFIQALELPTPQERAAFLDGACRANPLRRARVEALLADHFQSDAFMRAPAVEAGPATLRAPPPAAEDPTRMLGRYKLLEKIGEGGFGEVWMAEQREPVKRRVALKIVKLGMDSSQVVARFEAERQALALMDHANIAKIFDADVTDGGRPYFVMELVRGIKITEYCDKNQLTTRERLDLFIKVCQAIQHAHQKGIIHRDIKPSNILVTLHDGVAVPKVIDFGIAKATHQELTDKTLFTHFQQFIGTPAYISPEQAEMSGLDIDTRADIYSLGVLLYELLVGQTPFDAKEMMQGGLDALRQLVREKEPLRPSTRLNTLPGEARTSAGKRRQTEVGKLVSQLQGDLDWIVMKCLEKDRTRRYETANGLAADIQRHIDNEPVIARPPSAAYRFRKAFRRNKLLFTSGTAIVVTLVLGVIGTTTGLIRAEKQRQTANLKQTEAEAERRRARSEQQRANAEAQKASENEQKSRRLLYLSDVNLAQQSLKANNFDKARRLLDRHRPNPGEEDLRGWEWRSVWLRTRGGALATLTNRPGSQGYSVGFSADGKSLGVGWWDGRVDLWDVPGRRRVRALTDRERPHSGRVAFSPVRNLLAATSDSEHMMVTLYDLDSGRESVLWRAPDQGEWSVRDLAFSPDGTRVVIYAGSNPEGDDAVWVVNVSSFQIESRHPAGCTRYEYDHFGAARLSPDNRRVYLARSDYLNHYYKVQCIDLNTREELWQTPSQETELGATALDVSPDGRVLASASGFSDPIIRVWDAATGGLLERLEGHTETVYDLAFTRDGRHLVAAVGDHTIRFWDTSTWTETEVLRGHTGEAWAIAISEPAHLIASASKDGDLLLWPKNGKRAADGYRRLPEGLWDDDVQLLDHSRVLLLPPGRPPELVDLKQESPSVSLPEIGTSTNVLGCFGTNILCHWDGTNQIVIRELHGVQFVQSIAIALESGRRPAGFTYNPARRLLAWTEGTSPNSIYLASLAAPGLRIELKSDVPGLVPFRFSEDGNYLAATRGRDTLRVWSVESGGRVRSIDQTFTDVLFAANGSVLVVALHKRNRSEIAFYDLARPDRASRNVPGGFFSTGLAVSPDGGLVSATPMDGQILLLDAAKGKLDESLRGHLVIASSSAFSPDGRRLCSTYAGQEAVKVWDVATRQELLTLPGTDSGIGGARWSADGNAILAGPPWQVWSAPSLEEIEAAEAQDKEQTKKP